MIEDSSKLMQTELSTLQSFVNLSVYARRRRAWVVVVGGTKDMTRQLRQLMLSSKKNEDKYSGRTLRFPNGGGVSVTSLTDDFDPPEVFDLAVFGLSAMRSSEERGLAFLYGRATRVLTACALLDWVEETA